jgi:hypothetical protein
MVTTSMRSNAPRDALAMLPSPVVSPFKFLLNPVRDPVSYVTALHLVDSKLWAGSSDGIVTVYSAVRKLPSLLLF